MMTHVCYTEGMTTLMKPPKIERKKITDFTPDAQNANLGSERGSRMLDDSLASVGLGRSIVVDKAGRVIGGNKTQEAAVERGFEDAIVVHTDGDTLVVVQRDDLDLADVDPNNKARRMAYLDNRVSQVSLTWDAQQIAADIEAGMELGYAFSEDELAAIAGSSAGNEHRQSEMNVIGGMIYKIVITCNDEHQQTELLERFDNEGLTCQALIS